MDTARTSDGFLDTVRRVVADIFEDDPASLNASTRLMRDLPCESIDLLEIGVRLSRAVGRELDEDALFLREVRVQVETDAPGGDEAAVCAVLAARCPWLGAERRAAVARELASPEPFLTLGDMAGYLNWEQRECSASS